MRTFLTFAMILFMMNIHAQTLTPGDVIITGMNCKDPDQFCFLITRPINGNEVIYFTDCGWNTPGGFRPGEGLITYTVPASGLSSGTWITYPDDPGFTVKGISGFFGLSTDGDQLYCFTGSMAQPFFISALNLDGNDWAATSANNQTGTRPPINNNLSPAIPEADNAVWDCNLSTGENIYQLTGNPVNWIHSDTRQILPPVCSWRSLSINATDSLSEEIEMKVLLILSTTTETFGYSLDDTPIKINLYTITGLELCSVEPAKESAYLYTLSLPDLNFSLCVLEIITRDSVFRTLIRIP